MNAFLDALQWRGLLHQTAGDLSSHLDTPGRVGYCGFDPTADSLTIGHLVPMMMLAHFQRCGHRPIVLIGGGTGLIGDPSGKDAERQLQTIETVEENVRGQMRIFERVLDFTPGPNAPRVVNNADWLTRIGYIEMLRDVGKHFSVNMMMAKESVKERLHNRDQGISYTEFSYMILQAYDFLHLRREMNCTVQMSGSDQFGNIVAGIDLIRRVLGPDAEESFAATAPLVLRADGKKFGKTESGAVWLTADRTSPYAFYQFWLNTEDAMVIDYLKRFTHFDHETIADLETQHAEAPQRRDAHRALAREVTSMLHGNDAVAHAENAAAALFSGEVRSLDAGTLAEVFADVPSSTHARAALDGDGVPIAELLPETTLATSRRQAREFLGGGGVSVNGEKVSADHVLTPRDLLHGSTILIRRGKKSWHCTRWE
ncbi:MAG: tyrosine--tRNA ligase [Planctomycetes bacterium]|nr:tyrosine--tRNA ligase [Planctomycetota bacterium]